MTAPDDTSGTLVCNLDRRGARLRGRIGAVLGVATVAAAILVTRAGVAPAWRLAIFPLAYGAAVGVLQARAHT